MNTLFSICVYPKAYMYNAETYFDKTWKVFKGVNLCRADLCWLEVGFKFHLTKTFLRDAKNSPPFNQNCIL